DLSEKTIFIENWNKFEVNLRKSHKTGFYLDQREMRSLMGQLSKGKKVLNCFSYTGGFSVYAAKSGAASVTTLDISSEVIEQAKRNFEINDINLSGHQFVSEDIFKFLDSQKKLDFDIVILDP